MQSTTAVVPLRVSDEAFLVASTIERCPKTMMLRELVMNAIEAAATAAEGKGQVRLFARDVAGVPKLCIWNTGRGLSPSELVRISDLSSSLFKNMALDGNFGMGAKVASLASNKLGLRYRSCRHGQVSEIVIGQHEGVYGRRVPAGSPADGAAADVTALCRAEGEHDLAADWTEVLLLGNDAAQSTVLDPYAGNPAVRPDWIAQAMGRRFFRVPPGVEVRIAAGIGGTAAETVYEPSLGARFFDRVEPVRTAEGIVIHYGYRAADTATPSGPLNPAGLGAIVFNSEVYGLVEGRRWTLEAPHYGLAFASRLLSVVVELPPDFGVQPEIYRQFLRFRDGDQRQVMLGDFGELVRTHIPGWLLRIIDAMRPAAEDYLKEISADLQALMLQLGLKDRLVAKPQLRGLRPERQAGAEAEPPKAAAEPPPPPMGLPTPPEIILLHEETEIADRGLTNRAARYYATARQLFVNLRYAAFIRLSAQLAVEFDAAAEPATLDYLSRQVAEWALIRRLTRSVIYGLDKPRLGWSGDEVSSVQSAEALSLLVDDLEGVVPAARQRMAALLGLDAPRGEDRAARRGAAPDDGLSLAERLAGELAEAEANLQRARARNQTALGPYYRRIADIEMRRRNLGAAEAWIERAIATDSENPAAHNDLCSLRLAQGDLAAAAEALERAIALCVTPPIGYLRRRASIEVLRREWGAARHWLDQAMAADPEDALNHHDLAGLLLAEGDLDAAAAAATRAVSLDAGARPAPLRRAADIENRRRDPAGAEALLARAIAADPQDPGAHHDMAGLRLVAGDLDGAAEWADAAIARAGGAPSPYLRRRAAIEVGRKNWEAAEAFLGQAVAADPRDPDVHFDLAGLHLARGNAEAALEAIEAATARQGGSPLRYVRRRAAIETARRNPAEALALLEGALAAEPEDADLHFDLAGLHLAQGRLDRAAASADAALALCAGSPIAYLRRRSVIEIVRKDPAAAAGFLDRALALEPANPDLLHDLAGLRLSGGDLDGAAEAADAALAPGTGSPVVYLRRRAAIEGARRDWTAAQAFLERALAADPRDPDVRHDLAGVLLNRGELDRAAEAAEAALARRTGSPVPYLRRRSAIEMRRKNLAAAQVALNQALATDPRDPEVLNDLAGLRLAMHDPDGAAEAAEAALAAGPAAPLPLLRRRMAIEALRKDWDAAGSWLDKAFALAPKDPNLHYDRAGLLMNAGDLEGAARAAETALALSPAPSSVLLRRRADIAARGQDWASAEAWLAQAIALDPLDPYARHDLAGLRLSRGDAEGAAEAAEAAVARAPDMPAVLRRRAEVDIRRKSWAEAKAWMDRLIAADPGEPRWRYDLSSVLLQSGDLDGARVAVEEALRAGSPAEGGVLVAAK